MPRLRRLPSRGSYIFKLCLRIIIGFAKHPLDILREKKFDSLEVADVLCLAIIAELDAISLYLQLAKYIDDERVKKVFEDMS